MATARTKYQPRPVTCTPPAQVDQAQFGQIRQLGQFAAEVVAEAQAVSGLDLGEVHVALAHDVHDDLAPHQIVGAQLRPRSVAKRPDSIAS